ncbi:hypothetical protein PFISCL1PPCAC_27724, partial [Pristionchus fissidentatus]
SGTFFAARPRGVPDDLLVLPLPFVNRSSREAPSSPNFHVDIPRQPGSNSGVGGRRDDVQGNLVDSR